MSTIKEKSSRSYVKGWILIAALFAVSIPISNVLMEKADAIEERAQYPTEVARERYSKLSDEEIMAMLDGAKYICATNSGINIKFNKGQFYHNLTGGGDALFSLDGEFDIKDGKLITVARIFGSRTETSSNNIVVDGEDLFFDRYSCKRYMRATE